MQIKYFRTLIKKNGCMGRGGIGNIRKSLGGFMRI